MLEREVNPSGLTRHELLQLAQSLGVADADVMTRAELQAAIERAREPEPRPDPQPVTWVSVARRLLASIIEQGLNLPDAAALIRGDTKLSAPPKGPPPVATVTLARIYAAQGHLARAIGTLDEVLASEPDHDIARELREQLRARLEEQARRGGRTEAAGEEPVGEEPAREAGEEPELEPGAVAQEGEKAAEASAPDAAGSDALPQTVTLTEPPAAAATEEPAEAISAPPPTTEAAEPAPASEPPTTELEPPASSAPAAPEPARAAPRPPALLVLETGTPTAYVYWELPQNGGAPSANHPLWLWVVTYTPGAAASERRERCLPIHQSSGLLRVEGLAPGSSVRCKLARGEAPETPPLVVATCVRVPPSMALDHLDVAFAPQRPREPRALAGRAVARVESASPVYWS